MAALLDNGGSGERGVVLVFLMVLILAFLSMAALVIDIGRLLGVTRQAQNAADVAVLSATNQFKGGNMPSKWKRAKKAALAGLKSSQLWGCNATCRARLNAETFYFNDATGAVTSCDDTNYQRDTADFGNLRVKLERGVMCYQGGSRHFVSLESEQGYCHANAVRIQLWMTEISTSFGKLLGMTELQTNVTAMAYLNTEIPSCSDPSCASMGISDPAVPNAADCGCPCPPNPLLFPNCCNQSDLINYCSRAACPSATHVNQATDGWQPIGWECAYDAIELPLLPWQQEICGDFCPS